MTIWYTSDSHFGHANILKFTATRPDGIEYHLRPEFSSVEEMDETMIARWNERVKPSDHIWHLGDVAMNRYAFDKIMPRLSGHKRLLVGNHDSFQTGLYFKYFEKIRATHVFDQMIFSHIPLHPGSIGHRIKANIHGHMHNNPGSILGHPYLNISVEHTGYAPISLEEVKQRVEAQKIHAELAGALDTGIEA